MLTYLRTMCRVLRVNGERRSLRLQSYWSYDLLRRVNRLLLLLRRLQHLNMLLIGDKLRLLIRLLLEYYRSLDRLVSHKLPLSSLNIVTRWLLNLLLNLRSALLTSVPLSKALPSQEVAVRLRRSCTIAVRLRRSCTR